MKHTPGLKSLPAVEQVGWYVRTARTAGDLAGLIVANSGSSETDHYVFAPEHGNLIAALTAEAINTARETGIGPAEMRRQRDELLEALTMVRDADEDCRRDGLPTIPAPARAKIDAAIAKAEGNG